jgi:DNA polymerase I
MRQSQERNSGTEKLKMKKLILIDGNAILHRAFHALPPLNNTSGQQTNAVYGFFSMFFKIVGDLRPEYLAVCFDKAKPTFRKQMYVGYQAKRPKMDNDLVPQIVLVHDGLKKANVAIFEIDGYEADDLIGTLSTKTVQSNKDLQVIIVSGDRDMLQLVNSRVNVLAPIIGITKMILFDEEKVKEKYGLNPLQIIDYKALVGDASDNYPGVAGVGPKTASGLLQKYETFENLYKHLNELPEKLSTRLAQDAEQAALCKKLATIVTDAPITVRNKDLDMVNFNKIGLVEFFNEMGFQSLINRLNNGIEQKPVQKPEVKVEKKKDASQLGFF